MQNNPRRERGFIAASTFFFIHRRGSRLHDIYMPHFLIRRMLLGWTLLVRVARAKAGVAAVASTPKRATRRGIRGNTPHKAREKTHVSPFFLVVGVRGFQT